MAGEGNFNGDGKIGFGGADFSLRGLGQLRPKIRRLNRLRKN